MAAVVMLWVRVWSARRRWYAETAARARRAASRRVGAPRDVGLVGLECPDAVKDGGFQVAEQVEGVPVRMGWVCVDKMDERRATGFYRALAETEHREVAGGIYWSGASRETAERLGMAWVRDRKPPGRRPRRHG